jgi:hypothetical protein
VEDAESKVESEKLKEKDKSKGFMSSLHLRSKIDPTKQGNDSFQFKKAKEFHSIKIL